MAGWELFSGSGSGHEVSVAVLDEEFPEVVDVVRDLGDLVAMSDEYIIVLVITLAFSTGFFFFGSVLVSDGLAGESTGYREFLVLHQGIGEEKWAKATRVVQLHVEVQSMDHWECPDFKRTWVAAFKGCHVVIACIDHGLVLVSIVFDESQTNLGVEDQDVFQFRVLGFARAEALPDPPECHCSALVLGLAFKPSTIAQVVLFLLDDLQECCLFGKDTTSSSIPGDEGVKAGGAAGGRGACPGNLSQVMGRPFWAFE